MFGAYLYYCPYFLMRIIPQIVEKSIENQARKNFVFQHTPFHVKVDGASRDTPKPAALPTASGGEMTRRLIRLKVAWALS